LPEAVATARSLVEANWNASFGLGQINLSNLPAHSLDLVSVFDPCKNLKAASAILGEAFDRATARYPDEQTALGAALSAYYSGNFSTGFKHGYVQRVASNAVTLQPEPAADKPASEQPKVVDAKPIRVIPAIRPSVAPPSLPTSSAGNASPATAPELAPRSRAASSSVIYVAPN